MSTFFAIIVHHMESDLSLIITSSWYVRRYTHINQFSPLLIEGEAMKRFLRTTFAVE